MHVNVIHMNMPLFFILFIFFFGGGGGGGARGGMGTVHLI